MILFYTYALQNILIKVGILEIDNYIEQAFIDVFDLMCLLYTVYTFIFTDLHFHLVIFDYLWVF